MHSNSKRRALLVKHIVDEHYIAESHRGSMLDIYRRYVRHIYPMSEATFWRYMQYAIGVEGFVGLGGNRRERTRRKAADRSIPANQLTLF